MLITGDLESHTIAIKRCFWRVATTRAVFSLMTGLQSHNKCVEVTLWLNKHVSILREFWIFPGDSNHAVLL